MNRPEEIKARIDNIRQIESIVGTLRAMAAAHRVEARAHLEAIRRHEATVASALSTVLAEISETPVTEADPTPGLMIIVGAAQGFSGPYADRLAEAAEAGARDGARLMVVGWRTVSALEGGPPLVWSSDMAPHAQEVPNLASRLADALFAEVAGAPGRSVSLVFADPDAPGQPLLRRALFPFDFGRFPEHNDSPPMTTMPATELLASLVEEYVFTELCEALMLGFAAENAARAEAMTRAQSNVKEIAEDLRGEFQRARQEQMTAEIIEVSAGRNV